MMGSYLLNSDLAASLYQELCGSARGRVVRLALMRTEYRNENRNLYRALMTENGKRLLSYAATDTHFLSEAYSDYENFAELLHLLPALVGSGYHSFVRLFLEYLLGSCEPPTPDNAKALWSASLPLFREGIFDRLSEPFSEKRADDVTPWIFPTSDVLRDYECFAAYLSAYRNEVEGADLLRLDLSVLRFTSPDLYHAEKSYTRVRAGEGDACDTSYLASQMLRVTGEICKSRNIPLIFSGEPSFIEVAGLLGYLKRVDRMPRSYYAVPFNHSGRLEQVLRELDSLGILSSLRGLLPIGLSVGSAASIQESLSILAMRYPIGQLSFIAEGTTEAEERMEYECFSRLLSELLASAVLRKEISEADAITTGTNVLTSAAML